MSRTWHLTRGGTLLAVLKPDGQQRFADYPGAEASYETTPAFEAVRPLFEREAALLDADSEAENEEWAEIWEDLHAPGLFVESPGGRIRITILWIHFKDGRAWWFPLMNDPRTVWPELDC